MKFWGIDPGKAGGIAAIDERGSVLHVDKMPDTDLDVIELFRCCDGCAPREGRCDGEHFAILEKVPIVPKNGSKSNFSLGGSYRSLRIALVATGIRMDEASPQRWKKELGIIAPKGATDTEKKNLDKQKAQQLFPGVKVTHAIADALPIAEYARRAWARTTTKEAV